MKVTTVYFDMDGVLADFEGGLRRVYPTLPANLFDLSDEELWPKVMAVEGFWENLSVLPGARQMVEQAKSLFGEVAILSAPSRRDERCLIGKNVWLNAHFSGIDLERNFVRARNKVLFASSGAVLVDDQEKNCLRWREAGGIAILFENSDQTIQELRRV